MKERFTENSEDVRHEMVTRSNDLIRGRYNTTLLEQNMIVFSIVRSTKDEYNRHCAVFTSAELKKMMNRNDGGFYDQLKRTATAMRKRTWCIETIDPMNPRKKNFVVRGFMDMASFKNGIFEVKFSPEMNPYIEDLKSNFTSMDTAILTRFKSIYAYRLYELLDTEAFHIDAQNHPYRKRYTISDLKLQLSCVNTEEPAVQEALSRRNPDLDNIVENVAKEKHFDVWYEFKRNVLDVGVQQINKYSDLYVEYEKESAGRGGKVSAIIFSIRRNEKAQEAFTDESREERRLRQLRAALEEEGREADRFTDENLKAFLKAAEQDIEKVAAAFRYAKNYKSPIHDLVPFLITTIKNDSYPEEKIPMLEGSVDRAERVNAVLKSYDSKKASEKVWQRTKQKEEFSAFLRDIDWGIPADPEEDMQEFVEMIEEFYSSEELVQMYWDWRKQEKTA